MTDTIQTNGYNPPLIPPSTAGISAADQADTPIVTDDRPAAHRKNNANIRYLQPEESDERHSVTCTELEDTIEMHSPFHPDLPNYCRHPELDGDFDKSRRVWIFPKCNRDKVLQLYQDIFGENGYDAEPQRYQGTMRAVNPIHTVKKNIYALGRQILNRRGNMVYLGPDVQHRYNPANGRIHIDKTRSHAATIEPGARFTLYNLPVASIGDIASTDWEWVSPPKPQGRRTPRRQQYTTVRPISLSWGEPAVLPKADTLTPAPTAEFPLYLHLPTAHQLLDNPNGTEIAEFCAQSQDAARQVTATHTASNRGATPAQRHNYAHLWCAHLADILAGATKITGAKHDPRIEELPREHVRWTAIVVRFTPNSGA